MQKLERKEKFTKCLAESPQFQSWDECETHKFIALLQGKRIWGKDNKNIREGYIKDMCAVRPRDKRKGA